MGLWSLVLPSPPFTSHPSVPSKGVSEMLTANLPPQGTDSFSFFTIHSSCKENPGAAQLSCARIGIFEHLSRKTAAFPACSCPHAGSKPSISLPHSIHGLPDTCTTSFQWCFAAVPPFYPSPCAVPVLPAPAKAENREALFLFHLSSSSLEEAEPMPHLQDMLELNLSLALANSLER